MKKTIFYVAGFLIVTLSSCDKNKIYYPADFSENIYNDEEFVELMNLYALEYIDEDINYKLSI